MRRRGLPFLALIPAAAIASCNLALGIGDYVYEPTGTGGHAGSTSATTGTHTASSSTGQGGHGGQGGQGGLGGAGGLGGQSSTSATALWSMSFGDSNEQMVTSLATDDAGNVYVTGWFYGTLAFSTTSAATYTSLDGVKAGYVASFDTNGGERFAFFYQASSDTTATAVAVHTDGSFTVAGTFNGTLTLPVVGSVTSNGGYDAFLVNFDKNQQARWSAQIGGSGDEMINGLADRADGTVTVAGVYTEDLKADVQPATMTLQTSPGTESGFVFQVAGATGDVSALRGIGSITPSTGTAGQTSVLGVAGLNAGPVALVGSISGTTDFGNGHPYTSAGGKDAFLVQYSDLGAAPSAQIAGGPDDQVASGVAFLPDGALFLGGTFQDNFSFGGASTSVMGGGTDVFLLGLAPTSMTPTLLTVGATDGSNEVFGGLAVNPRGAALAGTVTSTATITLGASTVALQSGGGQGLFVAKASSTLDQLYWAASYGHGTQNAATSPVGIAPDGAVYVAGNFNADSMLDFGGSTTPLTSMGQDDIFLVKFAP
jgi:hypothetical protein